jgi:ribulose-phosphate 3-epimerase
MTKKIKIAPSILSADFARLEEEIKRVEKLGVDWLHVDVMDGHFVPNLTIGPCVVADIKKVTKLPLDVHLMIENPSQYLEAFVKAGSDYLTVHIEAEKNILAVLKKIKALGIKSGISLKPATPLAKIKPVLDEVDLVLIMSVNPGFGGQSFISSAIGKIRALRKIYPGLISVDGGINAEHGKACVEAGVDILVAGTYIFKAKDIRQAVESLRQ